MRSTPPAADRAHRLLAEWVCRREEAQGHPDAEGAADAQARDLGGDLETRIRTRARLLPGSETAWHHLRQVLALSRGLLAAGALLAGLAGVTAASAALDRSASVSVPLVLFVLVGVNVLSLGVWCLVQLAPGGGRWMGALWRRLVSLGAGAGARLQTLDILTRGGGARWRLGVAVHGFWLAYTLAGVATLGVLLVVRRYDLDWQTTLLDAPGLKALAEVLSAGPRWLGAAGPESLALNGVLSETDRRGWAQWVLLAVLVYGALPRAIALGFCTLAARRDSWRWGRDLTRPGYARLRHRLLPDHSAAIRVDLAPPLPRSVTQASPKPALPPDDARFVAVECPDAPADPRGAPMLRVDDADSRRAALHALRESPPPALVMLVRAQATADRGIERLAAALREAAQRPAWLALDGALPTPERQRDWQDLATRAGLELPLLVLEGSALQGVPERSP